MSVDQAQLVRNALGSEDAEIDVTPLPYRLVPVLFLPLARRVPPGVIEELLAPELPGATGVTPQSINDHGVVTGGFSDASNPFRGFIAFPDPADDLADLGAAVTGVGPGTSLAAKVRQAQAAVVARDAANACGALAGFLGEVKAQSGKKIAPDVARTLANEAQAIRAEVGRR